MPSGNTRRYVPLPYKHAITIHPMDHAESVVSPMSRSVSAEKKAKRSAAAAWVGWIRRTNACSLFGREGGSTAYGVKLETVG